MKHRSFFTMLLIGNLLLLGVVLSLGFIGTLWEVNRETSRISEKFQSDLLAMVRYDLEKSWPDSQAYIEQYCDSYSQRPEFRLTIIDQTGAILGDSEYPMEKMKSHKTEDRAEVIEALAGRSGKSVRASETKNMEYRYFAEPILHQGETVAVVRVAFPVSDILENRRYIFRGVLYGFSAMLFAAAALSVLLSWIWYRPLKQTSRMAQSIAAGNLDGLPIISGPLEMEELASSIDRMRRTVVSQLKIITQQREQFQIILQNLPDAVFALNGDNEVLYFNESAKKLFHLTPLEKPCHLQQILRHAGILDFYFRQIDQTHNKSHEDSLCRLDMEIQGKAYILELELFSISAEKNGNDLATLFVISDMTAMFRASQMKTDFVANASHELRTPLATIRAALDNIHDGVYDDAESLQMIFQVLNRHVSRLEALIEDLLSLHSVEERSQPSHCETTSVNEQRLWLEELFRDKAAEKNISLAIESEETLPPFSLDNKRLSLILQNLVDNAIKFTSAAGNVALRFSRDKNRLIITCTDNGRGIAPQETQRVFERFYQSNTSKTGDSRFRGTGLGLAIVKHAVERLHGTITLESTIGRGSIFAVSIPVEFS